MFLPDTSLSTKINIQPSDTLMLPAFLPTADQHELSTQSVWINQIMPLSEFSEPYLEVLEGPGLTPQAQTPPIQSDIVKGTMSHAAQKADTVLDNYKDTIGLMQTKSGKSRYYLRENGVTMRAILNFTEAGFTDEEIASSLGNLTVEQIRIARSFLDDMV